MEHRERCRSATVPNTGACEAHKFRSGSPILAPQNFRETIPARQGRSYLTVNAARQCIFSKIINAERRQSELKTDPGISTHIRAHSRREPDIPATPTCRSGDPLN